MSDMLETLAEPDEPLAEAAPKVVKRPVKSPSAIKSSEAHQIIRNSSEQAVYKSGSPFTTVNAIAKRSRQLLGGAPPLVTNANTEKPAMTALREIAAGVVQVSSLLLGQSSERAAVDPERELANSRRTLRERTRIALFGGDVPSE